MERAIEGISGLRDYLATERQKEIAEQFCRKLLVYALGRSCSFPIIYY
ncbi:MAG: hypothetical protein M2R45_00453 [Verrucomicrobia subdivision 3 bacterium]|nr:hypothetical protein [Limisphaerales bacterium]MCS1413667.1 hypothetical protein [Limisphaerales bacterium]